MNDSIPESKHLVVYVTAPQGHAAELARTLVERSLAACVTIVPAIRSVYRWRGEICDEAESLLVIKTQRCRFEALRQAVCELHSYEVPEVIALPVIAGHLPYLEWIEQSTTE